MCLCFPVFGCCLLSNRKSVIHLHVELGALSREPLFCSRAGVMVMNAELKSTVKFWQGKCSASRVSVCFWVFLVCFLWSN